MTDLNGQPARAYLTIIRMVEELGALAAEVRLLIPRVPVRVGPSWRSSPVCATRAAWAPVRGYASWATDLTANQNIEEGNLESDAAFVRLVEGLRTRARMYVPDDRFATLVAFVGIVTLVTGAPAHSDPAKNVAPLGLELRLTTLAVGVG